MKSRITTKGQVTIPVKIRKKLGYLPGKVLEFDENAPFLKAVKAFDEAEMRSVIGCCAGMEPELTGDQWLNETRGPVEVPEGGDEDSR